MGFAVGGVVAAGVLALAVMGPSAESGEGARPETPREVAPTTTIAMPSLPPEAPTPPAPPTPVEPDVARDIAAAAIGMPAPQVAAEGAADEGWRAATARRDWRAAYDALGHDALVEMTPTAPLADLLLIADVARLSDHPADAIAPLERAMALSPAGDPRTGLTAFTLGATYADQLHDPRGAVPWFERAIAEHIMAPLVPETNARLAHARHDAGDAAGAREAAQAYLAASPMGPRAAEMREIVGP